MIHLPVWLSVLPIHTAYIITTSYNPLVPSFLLELTAAVLSLLILFFVTLSMSFSGDNPLPGQPQFCPLWAS